jgi:signal transduction histidine kinase
MKPRMTPVRRLTLGYVLSLAAVALLLMLGQRIVQDHLRRQALDARLVNVAGRQRMLGERLAMHALALEAAGESSDAKHARVRDLAKDTDDWENARIALRSDALSGGTTAKTEAAYLDVDRHQRVMLAAARTIVADPSNLAAPTAELLAHEGPFLRGMEDVTFAYDQDASERVRHLARLVDGLFIAALLTLMAEGTFVFAPLVRGVRRAFDASAFAQRRLQASMEERMRLEMKLIDAIDDERRELGEDLHDSLCQQLVGVSYLLRSVSNAADGETQKRLQEAAAHLDEATRQARNVARGLHPVRVEQVGLAAALDELGERMRATFGVPCTVSCEPLDELLGRNAAAQLYRIAEEAAANAAKHAAASELHVSLREEGDGVSLEVSDDGVGIDKGAKKSMGLFTMTSRATKIGATLSVEARQGGGTVIKCRLPLPRDGSIE